MALLCHRDSTSRCCTGKRQAGMIARDRLPCDASRHAPNYLRGFRPAGRIREPLASEDDRNRPAALKKSPKKPKAGKSRQAEAERQEGPQAVQIAISHS